MPTGIEWTDETWNPITGCTKVSPGCARCYIERTPPFRKAGRRFEYQGKVQGVTTGVQLHPDRLEQPLRWKRPRRVFVNSLSDWLHEDVPNDFILNMWQVMHEAHRRNGHIFQLLTKREDRLATILGPDGIGWYAKDGDVPNPEPGIWLGVSAENQHWADRRIPYLLQTPAAVRFVSCEPLLGAVDLSAYFPSQFGWSSTWMDRHGVERNDIDGQPCDGLDWVIAGGESGPGARPAHPDWFRKLRNDCQAAGVPYFHKQNGEWAAHGQWQEYPIGRPGRPYSRQGLPEMKRLDENTVVHKVGKARAGALLDGREWREMPV